MLNVKFKCRKCYEPIEGTEYSINGLSPYCYTCERQSRTSSTSLEDAYQTLSQAIVEDFYPRPEQPPKVKSDGGSTDYYKLPNHATELRHLISHKGMSKSRGDIFKACYRLGEKDGADLLYDLKKIKFFAEDLMEMYERGEKV